MRLPRVLALFVILVLGVVAAPGVEARQGPTPVVRGVLFFSPSCGHCEYVIQEVLPPLYAERGGPWEIIFDESLTATGVSFILLTNGSLEFLLVDVSFLDGANLFHATTQAFGIASGGVPRLVIADQVMIGSADIPALLPGIVDAGLAGDGIDWPAIPGLDGALDSLPETPAVTTTTTIAGTTTSVPTSGSTVAPPSTEAPTTTVAALPVTSDESMSARFSRDPLGNTLAVVVLIGLLTSLVAAGVIGRGQVGSGPVGGAVPILAVLGLGIAAYLAYVEVNAVDAVCGPVGDCNAVQQSDYATFLGVPVGVIGVLGYLAIGALWLVQRSEGRRADLARVGLLVGTVIGVAGSAYLTFLEPFVIGATCIWCVASAIVMAALMWLVLRPGVAAWRRLRSAQSG